MEMAVLLVYIIMVAFWDIFISIINPTAYLATTSMALAL